MDFTNLPRKVLEKKFNTSDQIVMLSLMQFYNKKNNNTTCFKTVKTISKETLLDERVVIRSTAKLEKEGLITKEQRYNTSSIYSICDFEKFIMVPLNLIKKFKAKEISDDLLMLYVKLLRCYYTSDTFLEETNDKQISEKTFFCRAKVKELIEKMKTTELIKTEKIGKYTYKIILLEGNPYFEINQGGIKNAV